MKLTVKNIEGQEAGELEIRFQVVENSAGTQAVHDTVVAHQAAQRSGTACAKTRGEVDGTKKKPYRQKGTGLARAGSATSPVWVGGGVVFPPRPRDFKKKVNRATRQLALRKALSERLKAGDVVVVESLELASPNTKEFAGVLARLDVHLGSTLVVSSGVNDRNLRLAARNIMGVDTTSCDGLNTYRVLRYDKIVIARDAFEKIEQRLAS